MDKLIVEEQKDFEEVHEDEELMVVDEIPANINNPEEDDVHPLCVSIVS